MKIYFILLGWIIIIALLINMVFPKQKKKQKMILFSLIAILSMFVVMGLRAKSVGVDTELYCTIFSNFAKGNVNNANFDTSKVYEYYNIIVSKIFGDNERVIILSNSFVILLLFFIFNNKTSPNVYLSTVLYILLYFYLQSFNISRQFIAIMLSAVSMQYVVNKNLKKYLILNALSIFTHNTALIITIVGLILMNIKEYNIKKVIVLAIGAILSTSLLDRIIAIFLILFPKYTSYFTTNNLFYETGQGRKIILILVYAVFLLMGLYVFEMKKKEMSKDEYRKYMIYSSLIIFACVIGVMGMKSTMIGRVSLYFEIFMVAYIPMIIEKINKRKDVWYFTIAVVLFIPFYIQLSGNISGVIPYKFYS